MLNSLIACDPVFDGDSSCPVPCGTALLTPTRHADALAYYQRLREMRIACSAVTSSSGW